MHMALLCAIGVAVYSLTLRESSSGAPDLAQLHFLLKFELFSAMPETAFVVAQLAIRNKKHPIAQGYRPALEAPANRNTGNLQREKRFFTAFTARKGLATNRSRKAC